jgi:transcriptional regulator with XRE-family HTH domain
MTSRARRIGRNGPQAAEIGRRLRRLRELLNLTQAEIGARVGVSASSWNHYEQGNNAPLWPTAERIASAFGVTTDWIYRGRIDGLSINMWRLLAGRANGGEPPR